jgi:hypothetical protein
MSALLSVLVVCMPDLRESFTPSQTSDAAKSTCPALRSELCVPVIITAIADSVLRLPTPTLHHFGVFLTETFVLIMVTLDALSPVLLTLPESLKGILQREFVSVNAMYFLRPAKFRRKRMQVSLLPFSTISTTAFFTMNILPKHVTIFGGHQMPIFTVFSHPSSLARIKGKVNRR